MTPCHNKCSNHRAIKLIAARYTTNFPTVLVFEQFSKDVGEGSRRPSYVDVVKSNGRSAPRSTPTVKRTPKNLPTNASFVDHLHAMKRNVVQVKYLCLYL